MPPGPDSCIFRPDLGEGVVPNLGGWEELNNSLRVFQIQGAATRIDVGAVYERFARRASFTFYQHFFR